MIPRACMLTYASDTGDQNRDRLASDPDHRLFVVADGVGKRPGAVAASSTAVRAILDVLRPPSPSWHSPEMALREALAEAHRRVRSLPGADPALAGAATTLSVLLLKEDQAHGIHLGDSRILLYRRGVLRQCSHSHTVAAEVKRLGCNRSPGTHPLRHMLTRYLGSEAAPEPDLISFALQGGDWLVLCSDGLGRLLDDETLKDLLESRAEITVQSSPPSYPHPGLSQRERGFLKGGAERLRAEGAVGKVCTQLQGLIEGRERPDDLSAILVYMENEPKGATHDD